MTLLALLGAFVLASVHLLGERLAFLSAVPRSRWLSVAGGVSVAYVFVHILPELAGYQETLQDGPAGFLTHHAYLVALLGLAAFFGLERAVREDELRGKPKGTHSSNVFWLHIASFALYNLLIGYLLVRGEHEGRLGLILYVVALALHFVVNDHGLRQEHEAAYHRHARWLLAGCTVAGWAIGSTVAVGPEIVALIFALLSGAIVVNVLKEEMPAERQRRFWAFAGGVAGYAALLLIAMSTR